MAHETKKHELAEADYMSGMKYKDIAGKHGVSLATVKSWKTRYGWSRKGKPASAQKVCIQNSRKVCIQTAGRMQQNKGSRTMKSQR